jgi:hypothetical protein
MHSLYILPFAARTERDSLHFGGEWDTTFNCVLARFKVCPSAASLDENRKKLLPGRDFSRLQTDVLHPGNKPPKIFFHFLQPLDIHRENKAITDYGVRGEVKPESVNENNRITVLYCLISKRKDVLRGRVLGLDPS